MSLLYDSDNYELVTSEEIDNLVAELPFDLLKENILEQIDDPVANHVNYMETIITKCKIFKEQFSDDPDVVRQVDDSLYEFISFIINKINDRFDLGIDLNSGFTYDDMIVYGSAIYSYFILRYKKNITKFVINYINTHESNLIEYYGDKNKKDVSTLVYKKQIKRPEMLPIITNLQSIINFIIGLDIEPIEFVELSMNGSNYEANVVKRLIDNNIITGDFVRMYVDICIDDHEYIVDDIYTKIKTKLIKTYVK